MKKIIVLYFSIFVLHFVANSQKLNINDLVKLKSLSLNNAETFLSKKNFDFKDVEEEEEYKSYSFAYNPDKYAQLADEFLSIGINNNVIIPFMVWYQTSKVGWQKLKSQALSLGYIKMSTETTSTGELETEYVKAKTRIRFSTGKSDENNGALVYTLDVTINY